MNDLSKKILRDLAGKQGQRVVDVARRIREPGAAVQVTLRDLVDTGLVSRTGTIFAYSLSPKGLDWLAADMAEYLSSLPTAPKTFVLRRNDPESGLVDASYAHVLEIHDDANPVQVMGVNQGELIDLWTKIGVYFNLAGMRDEH